MWQAGFCYWNKSPLAVQSSLQGPYLCIERILSIKCSPGILLFSQALLLPFESISKACWPALLAASGVYQLRLVRRDNLVESNVLLQAKLLQIKKKWKRVICALAGTSSAQICWLGSLFLSFVCCHNHSRQECEGQRTLWPDIQWKRQLPRLSRVLTRARDDSISSIQLQPQRPSVWCTKWGLKIPEQSTRPLCHTNCDLSCDGPHTGPKLLNS